MIGQVEEAGSKPHTSRGVSFRFAPWLAGGLLLAQASAGVLMCAFAVAIVIRIVDAPGWYIKKKLVYSLEKSLKRAAAVDAVTLHIRDVSRVSLKRLRVASEEDFVHKPGTIEQALPVKLARLDSADLFVHVDHIYLTFITRSMMPKTPVRCFENICVYGFSINLETVVERRGGERRFSANGAIAAEKSSERSAGRRRSSIKVVDDEWEQLVYGALRALLGHDFVCRYRDYANVVADVLRKLAAVFSDLLQRYSVQEFQLPKFCVLLSKQVWHDLMGRNLEMALEGDAMQFVFDVQLEERDLDCGPLGMSALELCTVLTKRVLIGLGAKVLVEARRRLFNRSTMAEVVMQTLGATGDQDGAAAARSSAVVEQSNTLKVLVEKELTRVTQQEKVQEVLSVVKHSLFNAMIYGAGGRPEDAEDLRMLERSIEDGLVAHKLAALVRNKDVDQALKVLGAINVHDLLTDLLQETDLKEKLLALKVDIEVLLQASKGKTGKDLMEDALGKLGMDLTGMSAETVMDYAMRFKTELYKASRLLHDTLEGQPGEKKHLSAALDSLGSKLGESLAQILTTEDLDAFSSLLLIFDGMRARRQLEVAAAGPDVKAWDVRAEMATLRDDPRTSDKLRQAINKAIAAGGSGRASSDGTLMDTYLVLGVMEWAIGGLLTKLPAFLPTVATNSEVAGFAIQVSNLSLSSVVFPRDQINLSILGERLPPRGTFVATPFGVGLVLRYMKKTRTLAVDLLRWPLSNGSKYAQGYFHPRNVKAVTAQEAGHMSMLQGGAQPTTPCAAGDRPASMGRRRSYTAWGSKERLSTGTADTKSSSGIGSSCSIPGTFQQAQEYHLQQQLKYLHRRNSTTAPNSPDTSEAPSNMARAPSPTSVARHTRANTYAPPKGTSADKQSDGGSANAGFVTVKLSGIGGKIEGIKWSYRQQRSGLLNLEDAGSLTAWISGMDLCLELNPSNLVESLKTTATAAIAAADRDADGAGQHTADTNQKKKGRFLGWMQRGKRSTEKTAEPLIAPLPPKAKDASAARNQLFGLSPVTMVLTKCECKVANVRVEVEGSKHDLLYNFAAAKVQELIKTQVAYHVAAAIEREIQKLLNKLNDRLMTHWHMLIEKSLESHGRLVCTVVRAKDLAHGGQLAGRPVTDPYVRVVLLLRTGESLTSRNTEVAQAGGDSPSFVGLTHVLQFTLPASLELRDLAMVVEAWETRPTGTPGDQMIGCTMPMPLPKLMHRRLLSSSKSATEWWWKLDCGQGSGKVMVRFSATAAPRPADTAGSSRHQHT